MLYEVITQPQGPRAKVRSRIITSPRHMKRLLLTLEENLRKYEAQYGPIDPAAKGTSALRTPEVH